MKLLRLTVLSKIAILLLLACLILFVCIYDTPASISLRAQLFWMIFMCSCGLWDAAMSYPFNLFKGIRNCFTLQPSLRSQFCYFLLVWYCLFEFMSKKLQRFPAPFLDTTCSLPVKSSLQIENGWSIVTDGFHVAVHLFSNRSQMMSNCIKNKRVACEAQLSVSLVLLPHFHVFCHLLWYRPMAKWNLLVFHDKKSKMLWTLFNSQDLISNSPYCQPYSSCDVFVENLLLDQLRIPYL